MTRAVPQSLRWGACFALALGFHGAAAAALLARWNDSSDLVANAPLAQAAIKEVLRRTQGLPTEQAYQVLRHHDLPTYRAMLRSQCAGTRGA